MHSGHRKRMRQRVEDTGLDMLRTHEVLELLLYFVLPQRDVNPIAHTLLERFGSLNGVLHADAESLLQVPGLGQHSVEFLHFIPQLLALTEEQRLCDRPMLNSLRQASDYFLRVFLHITGASVACFSMNGRGYLARTNWLAPTTADPLVLPSLGSVAEVALACPAQSIVLAQRRPAGRTHPTPQERQYFSLLDRALRIVDTELVDVLFINGQSIVSMRTMGCFPALRESYHGRNLSLSEHWLD